MKKALIIFCLLLLNTPNLFSQDSSEHHGSIKLQRSGQLAKVYFDEVNYRLVGIDRFGNVLDSAVVEFTFSVTIKGIFYTESATGNMLTYQMQNLLGKADRSSRILFDKIKAKERNGTIIDMPPVRYTFGYSDEDND
jgi:hypothetical protein